MAPTTNSQSRASSMGQGNARRPLPGLSVSSKSPKVSTGGVLTRLLSRLRETAGLTIRVTVIEKGCTMAFKPIQLDRLFTYCLFRPPNLT
jgi:hypothetical protein